MREQAERTGSFCLDAGRLDDWPPFLNRGFGKGSEGLERFRRQSQRRDVSLPGNEAF
jgi:hypothetical protein